MIERSIGELMLFGEEHAMGIAALGSDPGLLGDFEALAAGPDAI